MQKDDVRVNVRHKTDKNTRASYYVRDVRIILLLLVISRLLIARAGCGKNKKSSVDKTAAIIVAEDII